MNQINFLKLLQYALGLMLLIDGVDKFFNVVANWKLYLAPQILQFVPVPESTFLAILGVTELAVGLIVFLRPKLGGLLVALLMLGISVNLLVAGRYYNIVLLDLVVGISALALVQNQSKRGFI